MIEKEKMGCFFWNFTAFRHQHLSLTIKAAKQSPAYIMYFYDGGHTQKRTTYLNISFRKSEMSKRKGIQNSTWNLLTVDNSKVPLVCSHFYCEQIIFLIMQTSEEDDSLTWFPWLGAILGFCRHINSIINTKCQN